MSWRRAAAIAAVALLTGCGFQPMYAEDRRLGPDVVDQLQATAIPVVTTTPSEAARLGQMLRNELLDRMTPAGEPVNPLYELQISLTNTTTDLLVRRDSTTSRVRMLTNAQYRLTSGDKQLTTGTARSVVSYDLPVEGYFAAVASARDGERQAATTLAEQIKSQLGVYFARGGNGGTPRP